MKDNRFIELVNLYIDRQITGEEMAALEAEMQENPRRRAVYRQYCQMHRATTLVYEGFRNDTSGQPADVVAAEARVTRFEPQHERSRTSWAYYATGLAAACVALVFARVSSPKNLPQNQSEIALQSIQPARSVAVAESPAVNPEPAPAVPRQEAPNVRPRNLVVEQDYAAMLAAMRREEQHAFASGQIQSSRATSLFDDGVFDSQQSGSAHIFRNTQTPAQQSEFTAFQFQR